MKDKNLEKIGKKNVLYDSKEPKGLVIKGYNFDNGVNYDKLFDSFLTTGFQASYFSKSISIINKMIDEKATIYLGYTSNMVTSGVRDIIRYLAENKKVHVLVTTAGGIEEDIIKCLGDFKLGSFSASGELLNKEGVNRAGNIFIPNSRYCEFEEFMTPILEKLYQNQKKTGNIINVSDFVKELGKEINNKESIYYWCYKNEIPVYCPAIIDGSIGDMIHFFMYKHPDFKMDIASDVHNLNEFTIVQKKTGSIILGGGVVKHHINNANMMRNGADYSVYINSFGEWDGSDSGARPDEAVSWGKIKDDGEAIKVFGDATILFPLIVSKTFAR
ncbi:MAG: deoxyhypusine synthase [Candidatus Pacearchaeota archaeon]